MVKRIKRKTGVKRIIRPRFGPSLVHGRSNPATRFVGAHGSRRRIYEGDILTTTSTTSTTTTTVPCVPSTPSGDDLAFESDYMGSNISIGTNEQRLTIGGSPGGTYTSCSLARWIVFDDTGYKIYFEFEVVDFQGVIRLAFYQNNYSFDSQSSIMFLQSDGTGYGFVGEDEWGENCVVVGVAMEINNPNVVNYTEYIKLWYHIDNVWQVNGDPTNTPAISSGYTLFPNSRFLLGACMQQADEGNSIQILGSSSNQHYSPPSGFTRAYEDTTHLVEQFKDEDSSGGTFGYSGYDTANTYQGGTNNYTYRFIIAAGQLSNTGSKIRLRFMTHSSPSYRLSIRDMWIGHKASSGNVWDFDGNQVQVVWYESTTLSCVQWQNYNDEAWSSELTFAFDGSKDFIISFNITSNLHIPKYNQYTSGGYLCYYRSDPMAYYVDETAPTGFSTYGTMANYPHLISKILITAT